MNIDYWETVLKDYWDQKLVQLRPFGFPLDFNRQCTLRCDNKNHASATQFPKDIDAYLQEERQHNAIIGPFTENPIEGSHIWPWKAFEHVSDSVRYVMRSHGYCIINYIDDFLEVGTPDVVHASFEFLCNLLERLGLTISVKKLGPPAQQAVCLGVLVNTAKGTISIPAKKLMQITDNVKTWLSKECCTKHNLQSLLGQLLYVHKCIRPAHTFLNRMLDLLRRNYDKASIELTSSFRRDLRWFDRFWVRFNGVAMYSHKYCDHTVELDACLTGIGGVWNYYVYHLPNLLNYLNLNIVHLEMLNILVAVRAFAAHWSHKKILIKCDNAAVVRVLPHSRTKDAFFGACA